MPVMDGFAATKKLTTMIQDRQIPPVPILGLSAFNGEEEMQRCHDVGMTETLVKPLTFTKLKEELAKYHIT